MDGDPEDLLRFCEIIKDLLNTNEPVEEIRTESQGQESENGRKLKTSRWRAILVRMVDIWKVKGKSVKRTRRARSSACNSQHGGR